MPDEDYIQDNLDVYYMRNGMDRVFAEFADNNEFSNDDPSDTYVSDFEPLREED